MRGRRESGREGVKETDGLILQENLRELTDSYVKWINNSSESHSFVSDMKISLSLRDIASKELLNRKPVEWFTVYRSERFVECPYHLFATILLSPAGLVAT